MEFSFQHDAKLQKAVLRADFNEAGAKCISLTTKKLLKGKTQHAPTMD